MCLFAVCQGLHSAKCLPSVTHGKQLTANNGRQRASLPCATSRAHGKHSVFSELIQFQKLFHEILSNELWKHIAKDTKQLTFYDSNKKILLFHVFQIVSTKSFTIVCLTRFDLTNFSVYLAKVHKHNMLGDSFLKNIISCGYNSILMYIKMIWFNGLTAK